MTIKQKDLTKEELEKILADDDLGIFFDDSTKEEREFANKFANSLIEWCEKYTENKKLFNIKKKKIKKIIYEDSSEDEEVETVIIRKKKESIQAKETQPQQQQQRQPTFNDLANMSIQNQIHKKLNEEKFNSLYAQLVNCRY